MTLVQPTVEMQQHIRSELNEDVSTRDKDLEHIKEWLRMQPHLPQFQGKCFAAIIKSSFIASGVQKKFSRKRAPFRKN